ncbi:MAG: LON peptidase substrate-binding domain-containing protein [Dehalococcoidia bacterium]
MFPLNLVLFPGMVLPIHVFEERYKLMMKHVLEGDRRFGVVLIKLGEEAGEPAVPYDVGTVARIIDVSPQPEGRMNITTVGEAPFEILRVEQQEPYLVGRVELLERPEVETEEVTGLAGRLKGHFQAYISLMAELAGAEPKEVTLDDGPEQLSYLVGSALRTEMRRKQRLLENPSVEGRLREELHILEEENLALQLFLSAKGRAEGASTPGEGLSRRRFSPN